MSDKTHRMMSISLSGIIVLMGFMVSMFLPITERLFLSPHALFAHQALMFGHQDTAYGAVSAVFLLGAFGASIVLGDWSDRVGDKKVLLTCMTTLILSVVIVQLALLSQSLLLLVFGRMLAGLGFAGVGIAQAALLRQDENARQFYMMLMFCAYAVGTFLGPMLADFLMDHHISKVFSMMFLLNVLLILLVLQTIVYAYVSEAKMIAKKTHFSWSHSWHSLQQLIQSRDVSALSGVLLLGNTGWSAMYFFIAILLKTRFSLTVFETGYWMMFMGIIYLISATVLNRIINRHIGFSHIVTYMYGLAALAI